jgi:hypothetical protein
MSNSLSGRKPVNNVKKPKINAERKFVIINASIKLSILRFPVNGIKHTIKLTTVTTHTKSLLLLGIFIIKIIIPHIMNTDSAIITRRLLAGLILKIP